MISIQQPEYFPWIGFIDKILSVDYTVFLDNVQFKKQYFENRNKIRSSQGWQWIRTPVLTKGKFTQRIMDVEIDNTQKWQSKLSRQIQQAYSKTPYWNAGKDIIDLICAKQYHSLVEFNMVIILFFLRKLEIEHKYCMASSLHTTTHGSSLVLEICQKMNSDSYLSGRDGRNYLDADRFMAEGIHVHYQDFHHPTYQQAHGEFIPEMSALDMYFNCGPNAVSIIKENQQ